MFDAHVFYLLWDQRALCPRESPWRGAGVNRLVEACQYVVRPMPGHLDNAFYVGAWYFINPETGVVEYEVALPRESNPLSSTGQGLRATYGSEHGQTCH